MGAAYALSGMWSSQRYLRNEVGKRTGQQNLVKTISERRLRWLGHTIRMDHQRIPQQALYWEVPGFKIGPGGPRANWRGVVRKNLQRMGHTWEETEVAALDRKKMASKCGPVRSYGCGMYQGQKGHNLYRFALTFKLLRYYYDDLGKKNFCSFWTWCLKRSANDS